MALRPIDIILRVLGVDAAQNSIGTAAQGMGAQVKAATSGMSKEFAAAQNRAERLEAILRKRPGNLGIQVATDQARKLRDQLRETAEQALKTNQALRDMKAPDLTTRMGGYNSAAEIFQQRQQQNAPLRQTLSEARNVGVVGMAVGGAGVAAVTSAALDAGQYQRTQQAIGTYEGGDKLFEDLKTFDQRAAFANFKDVSEGAQSALAMGFKAKEIIPLFDTLGDGIAKAGKGMPEFNASLAQLAQIKSKGTASMQDIRAMAEGGGLPIIPILEKQLGKERTIGIISGKEPIGSDEFFKVLEKGMKELAGGTMVATMDQLPNQVDNLTSSLALLKVEMGQSLVPAVKLSVKILAGITGFFRALPAPLKAVVSYGAALIFGLVGLGGAALATAAQIGLAKVAMQGLGGASGLGGLLPKLGGLIPMFGSVGSGIGTLISSLGGLGAVMSVALPLAIAAGIALMFKAAADAQNAAEDKYNKTTEPGTDLGDGKTRESANKQAEDFERRAQAIDEAIQVRKDAKAISWPINLKTGKTPAQYQDEIENLEMEKKGYLDMAAKRRAKASTLPADGSTPAPGIDDKAVAKAKTTASKAAAQVAKATEREAKAAQKAADKAADYASSVEKLREGTTGDLEKMRGDAQSKIAANKAKIGLDSQINRINDLKDAGVLDDDAAENQIERLKHAYEVRNAAMEKDALMRAAQVESQAELAAAQAEASTQEAAQAKATMDKARIKADAILEKAKIQASVIGTDIAPLEDKKSKFAALSNFLKGGGSLMKPLGAGIGLGSSSASLGGGVFGMNAGNYGAQSGAFSVTRGGGGSLIERALGGDTVFNRAYRNGDGSYRAPGADRKPPRARGSVDQRPDGSFRISFDDIDFPNPFQDALEAVG